MWTGRVRSARPDLAEVLQRMHRRVLLDLEHVAEGSELSESRRGFGLASLLLSPERFVDLASRVGRGGVQSAPRAAASGREIVTLRIECAQVGVTHARSA